MCLHTFVPDDPELFTGTRSQVLISSLTYAVGSGQASKGGFMSMRMLYNPYLVKPLLNLEPLLKVSLPLMLLLLCRRDGDQNYDRLYCESQRCKKSTTVARISGGISKNDRVVQPQFAYKGLEGELS